MSRLPVYPSSTVAKREKISSSSSRFFFCSLMTMMKKRKKSLSFCVSSPCVRASCVQSEASLKEREREREACYLSIHPTIQDRSFLCFVITVWVGMKRSHHNRNNASFAAVIAVAVVVVQVCKYGMGTPTCIFFGPTRVSCAFFKTIVAFSLINFTLKKLLHVASSLPFCSFFLMLETHHK